MSDCDWFIYSAHKRWLFRILAHANVKILLGSVLKVSSEGVKMLISTLTCTIWQWRQEKRVLITPMHFVVRLGLRGSFLQAAHIQLLKQKIIFFW